MSETMDDQTHSAVSEVHARIGTLEARIAELEQITAVEEEIPCLAGDLNIGDKLIWEPKKPKAYVLVEIVDVRGEDSLDYLLKDERGNQYWNEESRVREACIRR